MVHGARLGGLGLLIQGVVFGLGIMNVLVYWGQAVC